MPGRGRRPSQVKNGLDIIHKEDTENMTFISKATYSLLLLVANITPAVGGVVSVWRSSEDGRWSLRQDADLPVTEAQRQERYQFIIDPTRVYQSVLGFGASFDHASCYNLSRLDNAERQRALELLFDPEHGIGMNLMRVCMGTSDFVGEPWYTYNDLPLGETDKSLRHFSIAKDLEYVLPAIKSAQVINPELKFYASPWSPPAWMKQNRSLLGGRFEPTHYDAYARYFVKFIQAYESHGVTIHAVTLQNEPDYPNEKYPTCYWSAEEQRSFIVDHIGPLFRQEKLSTRIWCWDHNWNNLEFPRKILKDPVASGYVEGTAFHLYEGRVGAQSQLKSEFPEHEVYFTEGSTFKTRGAVEIIQILQNWARSYNFWVFMLDEDRKPNNGPHHASATPLELLKDMTVRINYDYYMYGQFMKFIQPGARRIHSSPTNSKIAGVAFENPDSEIVLVFANTTRQDVPLSVRILEQQFQDNLPRRSVSTYRWPRP